MQIGKLSLNSAKAAQNTTSANNTPQNKLSSNPFGVSFKGNVIQADVFESANKSSITNSISEKGKLFASAVVSGINNFNESFKSRMNSIVSFGKKVTTNVFDTIERIGNTEVTFNMDGIKNKLFPDRQYSVKNLTNQPVSDLKTMWQNLEEQAV
ncbi:MAG: hypothetical protein LUG16_06825 [Candidatus Gastranaerophilales bacterium]|nr:hypothetical protein [Candidatus Gastranaerophilales bacterium]